MKDMIQFDNLIQLRTMQDWVLKNVKKKSVHNIALPNVRIAFSGKGDVDEEYMDCTYNPISGMVHVQNDFYQFDFEANDTDDGKLDLAIHNIKTSNQKTKDWLFETNNMMRDSETNEYTYQNWHTCVLFYTIIQNYIVYHGIDELFDVEEKVAKQHEHQHKKGKNKKPAVRLYRCYKLKKDWESAPRLKKPIKYTCAAWGVRGHLRHYKSGKVGYVRPYVKGKDRDKTDSYVGKEYKVIKSS